MKKMVYTAMLVLLCWAGIQAQEHEYVPMLREDLTWVGWTKRIGNHPNATEIAYTIKYRCDTIVDGITYKAFYRTMMGDEPYEYYSIGTSLSNSHPAALLREDNGRIYRLCSKNQDEENRLMFMDFDYDGSSLFYECYPLVHETGTHYEVLLYDFNTPNIYDGLTLERDDNVIVEGISRRVYTDKDERVKLVEGIGMVGESVDVLASLPPVMSGATTPPHSVFVLDAKGRLVYDVVFRDGRSDDNQWYCDSGYADFCRIFGRERFDYTGDGVADVDDLNFTVVCLLDHKNIDMIADINTDGRIDIADVNLIVNRILGKH